MKKLNFKKLDEISSGNEEFKRKMVVLFKTTSLDALEALQQALAQEDLYEMARIAHRMKPSVVALDLKEMQNDITFLEREGINLDQARQRVESIRLEIYDTIHAIDALEWQ